MIPLSVLDLAPIVEGDTASDALRKCLDPARHVERLGYRRYWVAEHHNMRGIASAASSVIAQGTLMTGQTRRKPSVPAPAPQRTAATHASGEYEFSYRFFVRLLD